MLTRESAMTRSFEFIIKSQIKGDYAEFGVYEGKSLTNAVTSYRKLSERFNYKYVCKFHAFDSFKGLPKIDSDDALVDYDVFEQGQYRCSKEQVLSNLSKSLGDVSNINLYPGFYSKSLNENEIKQKFESIRLAVVHVDCDLYASARDCLNFIDGKYCDGAVLMFDDWFCFRGRPDMGVQKAFYEWTKKCSIKYIEYFRYSWAGISFILHH